MALKRAILKEKTGNGVLGQLTGQKQTDGRLDFPASDGRTLVVVGKTGDSPAMHSKMSLTFMMVTAMEEMPVSGLGVDLLQHFVDVNGVALLPLAFLLLVSFSNILLSGLGFAGLLRSFPAYFRGHSRTWVYLI